mgnify:CR=1 FL=1
MKIHLQTPEEIRPQIWKELGRASQDRHHEWRTPVLASADPDGLPDARTVVLRQVDALAGQLTFYTDSRSPKVAQLQTQAAAMLVFWSARLSWQLRVRVACTAITSGLIPWCFRMVFPGLRPAHPFRDLLHSMVWWALMGMLVSYFYTLQAAWFGSEANLRTVLLKVFVDMAGFTIFIGAPFNAISHLWKDCGWDTARLRAAMAALTPPAKMDASIGQPSLLATMPAV